MKYGREVSGTVPTSEVAPLKVAEPTTMISVAVLPMMIPKCLLFPVVDLAVRHKWF